MLVRNVRRYEWASRLVKGRDRPYGLGEVDDYASGADEES